MDFDKNKIYDKINRIKREIKMDVIFDMETGDPDDLITLLLLLNNSDVQLRGITCYQGSPVQIGLIQYVLNLSGNSHIPVGGWNTQEPSELSPYYTSVIGQWKVENASKTPVKVFESVFNSYPDVNVLTGAPLSNIAIILNEIPKLKIKNMITQGGYLGNLVSPEQQLAKFKGKNAFRTYNLGNDVEAFEKVNSSDKIEKLTYVTKDLCHGFMYTPEIHKNIKFSQDGIGKILEKCLAKYAEAGKSKAMHDPLAMLTMLYPDIGDSKKINMSYRIDERGHPVFSSSEGHGSRFGVTEYDAKKAWEKFTELCHDKNFKAKIRQKV